MKPTILDIQKLPSGARYAQGDPVLIPDADRPTRPHHATFKRYVSTAGLDRRVEVMLDGEAKAAFESYIVPDMSLWFREL